jgi:purine nucleosidase
MSEAPLNQRVSTNTINRATKLDNARRRFVIDTDTASDDAVAILMALMHPDIDVVALTIVAGNVGISRALTNALITLERCAQPEVPVHAGRSTPLTRRLETAQFVHGEDGMGDINLPMPNRLVPTSTDAVQALLDLPHTDDSLDLVTLGPLTNVAAALLIDPHLLTRYQSVTMMAGAPDSVGNVNELGEFNVWADPEAARIVMAAPGNKTMVGWNISRLHAVMYPADQAVLGTLGPLGEFCEQINVCVDKYARETGLPGFDLPDPIAMAIAIDPSIATKVEMQGININCDVTGDARGHSQPVAVDETHPAVKVVWEANELAFKQMLFAACQAGATNE